MFLGFLSPEWTARIPRLQTAPPPHQSDPSKEARAMHPGPCAPRCLLPSDTEALAAKVTTAAREGTTCTPPCPPRPAFAVSVTKGLGHPLTAGVASVTKYLGLPRSAPLPLAVDSARSLRSQAWQRSKPRFRFRCKRKTPVWRWLTQGTC